MNINLSLYFIVTGGPGGGPGPASSVTSSTTSTRTTTATASSGETRPTNSGPRPANITLPPHLGGPGLPGLPPGVILGGLFHNLKHKRKISICLCLNSGLWIS